MSPDTRSLDTRIRAVADAADRLLPVQPATAARLYQLCFEAECLQRKADVAECEAEIAGAAPTVRAQKLWSAFTDIAEKARLNAEACVISAELGIAALDLP